MGGRWINARGLMCKNPDLSGIPSGVVTPWGEARMRANWKVLDHLQMTGARIELPIGELVGTNSSTPIEPTDANKWNREWTYRLPAYRPIISVSDITRRNP